MDPTGELLVLAPILYTAITGAVSGILVDVAIQVLIDKKSISCLNKKSLLYSGLFGTIPGAGTLKTAGKLAKKERDFRKARKVEFGEKVRTKSGYTESFTEAGWAGTDFLTKASATGLLSMNEPTECGCE